MACRRTLVALSVALLAEMQQGALGQDDNSTTLVPSLRGSSASSRIPVQVQCKSKNALCGSNGQRSAICCKGLSCQAFLGSFEMRCADTRSPEPVPTPRPSPKPRPRRRRNQCKKIGCGSQGRRRDECECIEECLLRGTCCSDFQSVCKPGPQPTPGPTPAHGNYIVYTNKNAYEPYGAINIDTDATAVTGLTATECQSRCTTDPECMCATLRRSDGTCWRRKACEPSQWTSDFNDGYNVYLKRNTPTPAPYTPQPTWTGVYFKWAGQPDSCMDVAGGRDENFNKIQVWACEYPENQRFIFSQISPSSSTGQIRWARNPNKCLDVKDGNTENFADVILYDCHDSNHPDYDHQLFDVDYFAPVDTPGWTPLTYIKWGDKCVDLKDGIVGSPSQSDSKVVTYDCHAWTDKDWVNQQWNVKEY